MFNKDSWQEIFNTMKSNKLRSFLTAFGVFWGIFILVLILGSSRGFRIGIMQNFEGFAVNSLFLWSENTSMAYKGFNKNRSWRLKNDDITALKKKTLRNLRLLLHALMAGKHRKEKISLEGKELVLFGYMEIILVISKSLLWILSLEEP